jgi:hypothetical protein
MGPTYNEQWRSWSFAWGASDHNGRPKQKLRILKKSQSFIDLLLFFSEI